MTGSGSERRRTSLGAWAFATLPYITLLGCVGLGLTVVLGFEEPDLRWLAASSALIAAAPLGMALHMALTGEISKRDKRLWLASLAGMKDPAAFPDYFTPESRSVATRALRARAQAGRRRP